MGYKLLGALLTLISVTLADILVTTPKGIVRGRAILSPGNRTFYSFTGIPFAKPPIGELRFQAPVEADPWNGILNTTTDPHKCFQVNTDSELEDENCLFVNIFTPALDLANSTKKLPVTFNIYGGAFRGGSAYYGTGGPDWIVERDIVVVTFNYRVGPMGFLSTGDTLMPGNAGLKDQQLALQWTYNNIELFGGNKSHITIHGESAGGASVTYQLLNPKIKGLFKAALIESGSALCNWAWAKDNLPYTIRLATLVNNNSTLTNTSSAFLLEFLQNATARDVDKASGILYPAELPLPTIEPEHESAFITEPMYELVAAGNIIKVPLFIGINSEESIGIGKSISGLGNRAKKMDEDLLSLVPPQLGDISDENRTIVANLIKQAYVGNSSFFNKLGSAVSFVSDTRFTKAVRRFAELYSSYSPVYFYQFSYKGLMGLNNVSVEGADNVGHGEESRYLNVNRTGSYDNTKYDQFPSSDVLTHWRLIELWSNFYKYWNPTPKPVELLSNLTWPVTTPDNFIYLNINETLELKHSPKSPRYEAWKYIYNTFGIRPFAIY